MISIKGMGVSPGIAAGKVFIYKKTDNTSVRTTIASVSKEISRLYNAVEAGKKQLSELYRETEKKIGKEQAAIFEAHLLILEDQDFINRITEEIKNRKINAEWALENARDYYVSLFGEMESEYMRERSADIIDIAERILSYLRGRNGKEISSLKEKAIIAAKDLTPSDTAQMDSSKVLGILTQAGGKTSHSTIIARALGIPAIAGITGLMDSVRQSDYIVMDGEAGDVFINPVPEVRHEYSERKVKQEEQKKRLEKLKGKQSVTLDGHRIEVAANIASIGDLKPVTDNDAEGIGLFRTEFLYMDRNNLPGEEEQFLSYKTVAERMKPKPVIIRTMDIGGDKALNYLNISAEDNPFLGYRAIRLCLDRKELFKTQLRAIIRASAFGNIKIMFPMICTVEELREAKELLEQVKGELKENGVPFADKIETGIMIETPAAAIMSDLLAREADFFSIGTNDLIQYFLAVDRLNSKVSYLYSFFQPAVLRAVKKVAENAHSRGIWVGICGEAAGEQSLIPLWIGMGIDELSVSARSVLQVRDIIRKSTYEKAKEIVETAINLPTEGEVKLYLNRYISML